MRTKLSVLVAAAALLIGGAAKADTVSLIWANSGTPTTTGTSGTVVLNVVLTITAGGAAVDAIAFSVNWDGDNEVDFITTSSAGASPNGTGWDDISLFQQGSTAGDPGQSSQYGYEENSAAAMALGTATIGTITFHIAGITDAGPDLIPGFFNSGAFDTCITTGFTYCTGAITFNGANVIPEPTTVGLIGLGLAGLALMGRRSRRS